MNELNHIKKAVEKYGFRAEIKDNSVIIYAFNYDGNEVEWFKYDANEKKYSGNNTDHINVWLCDTRPDLTPENLVQMFTDIKAELKTYIAPEDWQEIASVHDAYEDKRYTNR